MGNLLRVGVGMSALVVVIGGAIYLRRHGSEVPNYHLFHQAVPELRGLRGIAHRVIELQGRAIIQLGLVLLIATPVARVAFSIFGFFEERDMMYVVFTGMVLVILLCSLNGSLWESRLEVCRFHAPAGFDHHSIGGHWDGARSPAMMHFGADPQVRVRPRFLTRIFPNRHLP